MSTITVPDCSDCRSTQRACDWSVLRPEELAVLHAARSPHVYRAGQVLFYDGNPCLGLHCIHSGEIALRKSTPQGLSRIVRLAHGGQTLGYRAFFSGEPYSLTAEVLTDSEVCFVPGATVRQLLESNAKLALMFLRNVAVSLRESEDDALEAQGLPVRVRLAHVLLGMKDRLGNVGPDDEIVIDLPLSRQDLAARVGARHETISRAIRALQDDGVAYFQGRRVRIPDLDRLFDEAESAGVS
jgi:CRP/FNR family transcriptional regulator